MTSSRYSRASGVWVASAMKLASGTLGHPPESLVLVSWVVWSLWTSLACHLPERAMAAVVLCPTPRPHSCKVRHPPPSPTSPLCLLSHRVGTIWGSVRRCSFEF
ncbi:hypothetical protein B0J18DRAFT_177133 [Chaetomium sp. MPI-SDFR-AT-0129]|nr:hypothetical protein B0J18DRAFT_177133 [Chaetomium sp. MPI-SDFR-AT-0129]